MSVKGVDFTGLLGGHKRRLGVWVTEVPQRVQGRSPSRESGGQSPPEAEVFFVKLHIIFALKYNKQQLLLLESTTTSLLKYWGGDITMDVPS